MLKSEWRSPRFIFVLVYLALMVAVIMHGLLSPASAATQYAAMFDITVRGADHTLVTEKTFETQELCENYVRGIDFKAQLKDFIDRMTKEAGTIYARNLRCEMVGEAE